MPAEYDLCIIYRKCVRDPKQYKSVKIVGDEDDDDYEDTGDDDEEVNFEHNAEARNNI